VAVGEPDAPEPEGDPDGLDEVPDPGDDGGGAGAAGGGLGAGGIGGGRGGIGTLTVGSGGGGGAGGTGGGGGACVVVGSGSDSVGTETVGSSTWPSACAVSTPARPPAHASAAAANAALSLFATVPLGRCNGARVLAVTRYCGLPRACSSAGERPLHTREVTGSIPVTPIA
jgi:hypothetical protein